MADNEGRLVSDEVRARLIGAARERGFVNYKELVIIMGHENPKRGDYSPWSGPLRSTCASVRAAGVLSS